MKLNVLPQNPENTDPNNNKSKGRFPSWLHRTMPKGHFLFETQEVLSEQRLPTVCEEAKCPNRLECWSKKTATFLALGKECTRSCGFCTIDHSKTPKPLDNQEPLRIAKSVLTLGLKHVVVTQVARDDLIDGGAFHLAEIISTIRKMCPGTTIEVLTSDFAGNLKALETVLIARPTIFNHNIETVRSLSPKVRHKASYEGSLTLLKQAQQIDPSIPLKSGLMVGLGETESQVFETLQDLKEAGCHIVTIGQYLQSHPKKLKVKAFIHPNQFDLYAAFGTSIGIPKMFCGPLVRSSYHAKELL